MAHTGPLVWVELRTQTFVLILVALLAVPALTTSVAAQESDPVNIAAAEQSNTTFVDADAFAPFRRLGSSPAQVGLLLPAVQTVRGG